MQGGTADVEAYLARLPAPQRAALETLRARILKAAPGAVEVISYGMPTFKLGRGLVAMAAFKSHLSLFPMSNAVMDELADEVAPWKTSKGTLQFTPETPLPAGLVAKLVKARIRENAGLEAKRKARIAARR